MTRQLRRRASTLVFSLAIWAGAMALTMAETANQSANRLAESAASAAVVERMQSLAREQTEFFENRVRPILTTHCYECHSGAANPLKGGLELDWRGGWEQGGNSGAVIVPGNPDRSLLIRAVRYNDPGGLQMPPKAKGKLSDAQIADLVQWVRMGAPDPRASRPTPGTIAYGGRGKEHWAFKAVARPAPPAVKNAAWIRNDIDRFVLAKLEAEGMSGSEMADRRTLIRRASFDLTGLPPTPAEVQAFLADNAANAFERVVDRLLASPRYGERWGRHWLDVARYADSKGQHDRRRESSLYPYAWTYRDYVIKAFNDDLPYDQFIREQLAADRLGGGKASPTLAALGFLTLGDHFGGNQADIINDRIDVTSKAFLGLTVSCARCHDHKFDPIPTADYYSLYGIFASSIEPREKPIVAPPNAAHAEYLVKRKAMDDRLQTMHDQNVRTVFGDYQRHGANYLLATTMPQGSREAYLKKNGASPELLPNWVRFTRGGGRAAVAVFGVWNAMARIPAARFAMQAPRMLENIRDNNERAAPLSPLVLDAFRSRPPRSLEEAAAIYGKLFARSDPEWQSAFGDVLTIAVLNFVQPRARQQFFQLREASDLLELSDPGAPARAPVLVDSPTPRDSAIFVRGQAESPGDVVPRRFLEVLSGRNRPAFRNGSGRLELANAIASKANPLTARVMVNRVWQQHFGDGFVTTPDDLGNASAPPSHPELLDWLATRFMADNWSIKKLHKLIVLSATWQQSSRTNTAFAEKDPFNRLLWRANVRRLEFEPMRDAILSLGGGLDVTLGGHPVRLDDRPQTAQGRGTGPALAAQLGNAGIGMTAAPRRSIYGFVDRGDLADVLTTFDFPSPEAPSGRRYATIVPQQALFLMNSPLVIEQIRRVVSRDAFQNAPSDESRIGWLYELFFQRPPTAEEIRLGKEFVTTFTSSGPAAVADPAGRASMGRTGRGGVARGGVQGRRGMPPPAAPVRVPLTGWQEYAHALLLTNEAAFVQ